MTEQKKEIDYSQIKISKIYNCNCDDCSVGLKTDSAQRKVIYYNTETGEGLCYACQKENGVNWKKEYKEQCKRLGIPEKILRTPRRRRSNMFSLPKNRVRIP